MTSTAELLIDIRADASQALGVLRSTADAMRQMQSLSSSSTASAATVATAATPASATAVIPAVASAGPDVSEDTLARVERLAPAVAESGKQASAAGLLWTKFGDSIKEIGNMAAGMATGMLVANLTMGVAERFKDAAEQIDTYGQAVLKVQRITGESTTASSELVAVFERFSPSLDEATTRLSRFEKNLASQESTTVATAASGKTAAAYLHEFGVQADDASGRLRPTTDILLDLAEGFKNSGDAAQKNAALTALFGRGSQSMLLMLDQGKASLQEFMAEVQKYGLVLSSENVRDVQAFVFAHKDMDMALQGVSLQLGAAFMPGITAAAQATAGFAQTLNSTVVPVIKKFGDLHIDWLVPATAGVIGLSIALRAVEFVASPLIGVVGSLGAAITGQGGASAKTALENAGLATSETAVGDAAVTATPEVEGLGAASTSAGAAGAAGFARATAGIAGFVAGIGVVIGAFAAAGTAADKLADYEKSKGVPDWATNIIRQIAPPGAADLVSGWKQFQQDITAKPAPASALAQASSAAAATAPADETESTSAGVKAATAASDAAKAHLQDLQDDAANRKGVFAQAEVGAETSLLNLKMAQSTADASTLDYKRQIEDLDRNAVNFAQQRLQLEEQANVLRAQQAESPLKNADEDIRFQEDLIKAKMKAAQAGGPAVDRDALRAQMRSLTQQDAQMQPALLTSEHNVTLADRAKSATDLDAGLAANATAGQKLDITEAMAPATAAAALATRAVEDAQHLLDLDKQRFDLSDKTYATALLLADATKRAAEHTLFMLQHPDAAPTAPAVAAATAPASAFNTRADDRREDRTPQATALDRVSPYTETPGRLHPLGTGAAPQPPSVNIDMGGVVMHSMQDADAIARQVKDQLVAAWRAAMQGTPVGGAAGGAYASS